MVLVGITIRGYKGSGRRRRRKSKIDIILCLSGGLDIGREKHLGRGR